MLSLSYSLKSACGYIRNSPLLPHDQHSEGHQAHADVLYQTDCAERDLEHTAHTRTVEIQTATQTIEHS
jgi:hypothetical protein